MDDGISLEGTSELLPVAVSARRSLSCSCLPVTSTADTRTENLAPVLSFWSLMSRNNQSMAHGMTPREAGESSTPSIVYVLPEHINTYIAIIGITILPALISVDLHSIGSFQTRNFILLTGNHSCHHSYTQ